jgi:chromosome segregation ATPase
VNWRGLVTLIAAVVLVAGAFGYLLGRRPTTNERALERRIGALVAVTAQLEDQRQAALAVADSARTRAADSDSAARAALTTADRALAFANAERARRDTSQSERDVSILQGELDMAGQIVDTLTTALTATRNQLIEARSTAGLLRGAVDSLTAQTQRDGAQITALEQTLTSLRAVQPGRPLFSLPGGTLGKIVGAVAVGFVAGAIVAN